MRPATIIRSFIAGLALLFAVAALADEQPQGLLLRKGLISWQDSLKEARQFIEENIHPRTMILLRGQKEESFGCQNGAARGVRRCNWACCVDLGERDLVHFATMWFYNDRFYAYDVGFDSGQFPRLDAMLTSKFGKPSRQTQQTLINTSMIMLGGGVSSYVVHTKRWDAGKAVILLSDAGGEGKPLVGHIYVTYLPLAQAAEPPAEAREKPRAKLPF